MSKEKSLNHLLYIQEHLSCRNYMERVENGFKYLEFEKDETIHEKDTTWNYLLFIITGECTINCNEFRERTFKGGEIILLPKLSMIEINVKSESKLISLSFSIPEGNCDKFILQSLSELCKTQIYDFEPLKIRYPLQPHLEVITYCLRNKMDCGHFHILLQQELFFLLRGFYTKEELAQLFYPIIGKEMTFKDFVIENYYKVNTVDELIAISNMGRSRFTRKFKEVFRISPKQWLLKQKDKHILNKVMDSHTTVGELMDEFNFDSQAHFTHYCKQHFNCTPKELLLKYQVVNQ